MMCMYVYTCIDEWMDESGWMDRQMDVWECLDEQICEVRMDGWMDACIVVSTLYT